MGISVPQLLSLLAILSVTSAFSPSAPQPLSSQSRRTALSPSSPPCTSSPLKPSAPLNPLSPLATSSPKHLTPLSSSYLDSLSPTLSSSASEPLGAHPYSSTEEYLKAYSWLNPPPSESLLRLRGGDSEESTGAAAATFSHAQLSWFSLDKLTPKGKRQNADVGNPCDATRLLAKAGPSSAGSWSCTEGGWPSPNGRATTEAFYVLTGRGCFTDVDGMKHEFGPGDTVVLPKGWSGRWDILEAVHKVWFVLDHPEIDTPTPIRPVVAPFQEPAQMNMQQFALHGSPTSGANQIYQVPSTSVGFWKCSPGGFSIDGSKTEWLHVLEGTFFLSNPDGSAQRCTAGDTILMPKGWRGQADIVEAVKAVSVVAHE